MENLQLDDSLRTGFDNIDEQHLLFLAMLLELAGQVKAGQHRQGVLDALTGMRMYAGGHFVDEETLMSQYGYPQLGGHKHLHNVFRSMVADFESRIGEGDDLLSREALDFLNSWFAGHICREDMLFAAFVREYNIRNRLTIAIL